MAVAVDHVRYNHLPSLEEANDSRQVSINLSSLTSHG